MLTNCLNNLLQVFIIYLSCFQSFLIFKTNFYQKGAFGLNELAQIKYNTKFFNFEVLMDLELLIFCLSLPYLKTSVTIWGLPNNPG